MSSNERVDAPRAAGPEHGDRSRRQLALPEQPGADGVVDVVIDVGHPVDHAHDPPLQRPRRRRPAGVMRDPLADLLGEVQAQAVTLELLDDPKRVLVVPEVPAEARFEAFVEHLLAQVPERGMTQVVAEPDRLDEVLVQAQSPGDGARDRRHLERVCQTRPVMVPAGGHEHLSLVCQAAKGLAVDDPVAVALKRRAQGTVRLLSLAHRRVGARCQRREQLLLQLSHALGERRRDKVLLTCRAHPSIVPSATAGMISARVSSPLAT